MEEDVTKWLNASSDSRDDDLFNTLYRELKQIAGARMASERQGHTLGATALVHEAWMRLEKSGPDEWRDRSQFFASAAEAMRRILIEAARRRLAAKRGGGEEMVPADEIDIPAPMPDEQLIDLHEALNILEKEDEMKAQIVKLRFFGGLKNTEIAALLGVNEKTVRRHWSVAKVLLYQVLKEET
jgi:RNA polymerase sigma factor (TIGR02999 family)